MSAWLLGAVAATAGSLYAVAQLGQGLIEQHTSQVSVAMVNAQLAQDGAAPATNPVSSPSPTVSPKAPHSPATPRSGGKHQVAPPVTYSSKVLTSEGGWAEATCGPGGARLLYESPAQGFEVFRVVPGPSPVASVEHARLIVASSADSIRSAATSMAGLVTSIEQNVPSALMLRPAADGTAGLPSVMAGCGTLSISLRPSTRWSSSGMGSAPAVTAAA